MLLGISWYLVFEILIIKNNPKCENEIFLTLKWSALQKVDYQIQVCEHSHKDIEVFIDPQRICSFTFEQLSST